MEVRVIKIGLSNITGHFQRGYSNSNIHFIVLFDSQYTKSIKKLRLQSTLDTIPQCYQP